MEVNIVRPFIRRALQAFCKHDSPELIPDPERVADKRPQLVNNTPRNNDRVFHSPVMKAMSTEAIEEHLAGVPVYALSNANEEFVLVSGTSSGKNLGLFCFKKEDAEALLEQVKSIDPLMRTGSKVVPVALNKIEVDGVAFRLIPESSQVQNAVRESGS